MYNMKSQLVVLGNMNYLKYFFEGLFQNVSIYWFIELKYLKNNSGAIVINRIIIKL